MAAIDLIAKPPSSGASWRLRRKKNLTVLGTWHLEEALHVSVRHEDSAEDPLNLVMLAEYYCLPLLGEYSEDEYEVLQPLVLIHLPDITALNAPSQNGSLLLTCPTPIPKDVTNCFSGSAAVCPDPGGEAITHAVIIHSCPSQAPALTEVNVLPHTWVARGLIGGNTLPDDWRTDELDETVLTGVLLANGVHRVRQDVVEHLNGMQFGSLEPRIIHVHHGRLSPNNCQVGLSPPPGPAASEQQEDGKHDDGTAGDQSNAGSPGPFHSFCTPVHHAALGRTCVVYHLVPRIHVFNRLLELLKEVTCLHELLERLKQAFGQFLELDLLKTLLGVHCDPPL